MANTYCSIIVEAARHSNLGDLCYGPLGTTTATHIMEAEMKTEFLDWCAKRSTAPYIDDDGYMYIAVAITDRFTRIYQSLQYSDECQLNGYYVGIYDHNISRLLLDSQQTATMRLGSLNNVYSDSTLSMCAGDISHAARDECAQQLVNLAREQYGVTSTVDDVDNWAEWVIPFASEDDAMWRIADINVLHNHCRVSDIETLRAIDESDTVISEVATRVMNNIDGPSIVNILQSVMSAWDWFNALPADSVERNVYNMYHALDNVDTKTVRVTVEVDGISDQLQIKREYVLARLRNNRVLDADWDSNRQDVARLAGTVGDALNWKPYAHFIPLGTIARISHGRKTLWERPAL